MKRKRSISILAAAVMMFCLAGCQMNDADAGQTEHTSSGNQQTSVVTESAAETSETSSDVTENSETEIITIHDEKTPTQSVSEKNTGTGEKDIISECINDLKSWHSLSIIDHTLYDIDGDNNDELLILSEGALLYNCSELHVYRIDDKGFRYCDSIDTLLQRELYDDIADRNSNPMAYSKLDIKKFSYGEVNYNCVFTSSVRTAFSQWNYVSAIAFDEDDMITEIPLLMWGIDIPAEYNGEELIPGYYFYNEGVPEEVTYEDIRYYLSLLEDTSAGE